MTGKVLELQNVLQPDMLATRITERWVEWDLLRQIKKNDWEEIRRYVYATDTTQTTNAQLPWKNKTTVPKLCQIRDNLYANYSATMFPQKKWLIWEANEADANSVAKAAAITNYMAWVIDQPWFRQEVDKLILDYIDFGNAFVTVDWLDQRVQTPDKTQVGYTGPVIKRISPLDMVMNPTAENFTQSPKMIRSMTSMGELRKLLNSLTTDENRQEYEDLYDYLKNIRYHARTFQGDWIQRDHLYSIDGFTSYRAYLLSDFVEVLTFYGDYYDHVNDIYEENRVITVVDRHKLIGNKPNPSFFGYPPINHSPWRKKQENLWGMGPLDNLVGMQYRLDHIENMGADIWDFVTFPVQKIKGFVEDYTWQPGEKIFVSDEGDVELVVPDVNVFQSDMKIERIEKLMEEMAGAPREAMGFRTPGEKTKYEVQSLENAASRLFQNKIKQFEEQILEPALNAMLELARRNMVGATTVRIFDNDTKASFFQQLTVEDITGAGRIIPVAARHYSEYQMLVQNMTNLAASNLWPTVQPHFSGIGLAKVLENIFDLEQYGLVSEDIALVEQAKAQQLMNVLEEQVHQVAGTASGIGEDHDLPDSQKPSPPLPPPNNALSRQ
jgi:hypothetical protein